MISSTWFSFQYVSERGGKEGSWVVVSLDPLANYTVQQFLTNFVSSTIFSETNSFLHAEHEHVFVISGSSRVFKKTAFKHVTELSK